tara:strand:- start:724 stop:918 length:195 start_codon:yes stop_codon:yes gene_type:complete
MKNFITNYRTFITECETPLDYFLIGWAHFLAAIVVTGTGRIAYELITNPSTFDTATWGIFDTLG